MTDKILGYIGLAIRGKFILLGEDNLKRIKKSHLLFLASDASEILKEKVKKVCDSKDVTISEMFTKDILGQILNKNQVAILVITNYSLANQIKKYLNK